MRLLRFVSSLALLTASACTHIETLPDAVVTPPGQASRGVPYALPMLQYKLEIVRSLKTCPSAAKLEHGKAKVVLTDPSLIMQVKVEPTARYVPAERYVADYTALSSFLKTTGYGMENYASGTLKSINVSAEDHTGDVLKDTVAAGLAIASLGAGSPVAALTAGSLSIDKVITEGGREYADGRGTRSIRVKVPDPALEAAIRQLELMSTKTNVVSCTPEAVAALKAIDANAKEQERVSGELKAVTRDVERLTVMANLEKARDEDVAALGDALERQSRLSLQLDALLEARVGLNAAVSVKTTEYWPRRASSAASDNRVALPLPPVDMKKLEDLLAVEPASVVTAATMGKWLAGLRPKVRAAIWKESADHLKAFVREDGTVLPVRLGEAPDPTCVSRDPDKTSCLVSATALRVELGRASNMPPVCPPDAARGAICVKEVAVDEKRKTGRIANDAIPDPGIFVRTPGEASLLVCRDAGPLGSDCPRLRQLVRLDAVPAPQFGQLRFLPFSNGMFEAGQLSVALREDGAVEKLEYKKTKSAGTGAAAAVRDALTQYQTYEEKRTARRKSDLVAARAEAVANLQFQIDTLTKKKEILKLQAPDTPDALAAVKEETAAIEAQTALLEARLGQVKAEAALVGFDG